MKQLTEIADRLTTFASRRRHNRRALAAVSATALIAALTACSSSSSSPKAASTVAGGSSPSVSYAAAQVATYRGLRTAFSPPGPVLNGVKAKLSGRTVWFIPVFLQASSFQAEAHSLTAALQTVGAQVHICDARLSPSTADRCVREAIATNAAGIVTSAIDYAFAPTSFKAAAAAHIPVVAADDDDTGAQAFPASSVARQLTSGAPLWAALAADWIIADSKGRAHVLYAADDASAGVIAANAVTHEFAAHCPQCKVTVVHFSDAALPKLATAVSSGLISAPDVNYVYGAYDAPAGIYALQGAKQIKGRTPKFVTITGSPVGLARVAAGDQAADAGVDTAAFSWIMADALFRLILGVPQVTYQPQVRLFTKDNVPHNTKNVDAYNSGSWYSNGGFRAMYLKVWGLS